MQSVAGYVLATDAKRLVRPFEKDVGTRLAESFTAAELLAQPADRPFWWMRNGSVVLPPERKIVVYGLTGNANELTATVEGTSSDAEDVVDEAWSRIGKLAGEPMRPLTGSPGAFSHQTTAIVKLDHGVEKLLPVATVMSTFVKERLAKSLLDIPGTLMFRLELPVSLSVRGLKIDRTIVIEPRFTSLSEDKTYFTLSPLKSEDHVDMLEAVVRSL